MDEELFLIVDMLKVNFESKTNPKCFWAGQSFKGILLSLADGWGTVFNFLLQITSWASLVGSEIKLTFQLKAHSLIFAKLLLSSEELIVTSWTTKKRDVTSAKNLQFDDKPLDKSFK